jgi:hypothetical protein
MATMLANRLNSMPICEVSGWKLGVVWNSMPICEVSGKRKKYICEKKINLW